VCKIAALLLDRHRMRQLLVILCDNAVKYNHPGGSVWLALEQESEDAATSAILRIANTGPGISKKEQGNVFERFY
jgi:signal transduction histidine kinase